MIPFHLGSMPFFAVAVAAAAVAVVAVVVEQFVAESRYDVEEICFARTFVAVVAFVAWS